jgi:two-component system sensor kinase FixL
MVHVFELRTVNDRGLKSVTDAEQSLAVLLHELRQPLSVINLLADNMRPDRMAMNASRIIEQVERIKQIMRQVRDDKLHRETTPINPLICETIELVRLVVDAKGIEVIIDLDCNITISIDKGKIEQVLVNLIRNALEAMQTHGGRYLIVASKNFMDHVEIAISDDGPGISPVIVDRLFQPLVTSKANGMGIGLAISRAIVHAHNGDLVVHPVGDKGTCFVVKLPL